MSTPCPYCQGTGVAIRTLGIRCQACCGTGNTPTMAWCPYCDESVYDTQTNDACDDCQKAIDKAIESEERNQP